MTSQLRTILRHSVRSFCAVVVASAALTGIAAGQQATAQRERAPDLEGVRLQLAEHAERIQRLEDMLEELSQTQSGISASLLGSGQLATGWRSEAAWERLSVGMSEAGVIAILGRPSRIGSGATHRTLFYEDGVEGEGTLRGSVRIVDEDWVSVIRPPTMDRGN